MCDVTTGEPLGLVGCCESGRLEVGWDGGRGWWGGVVGTVKNGKRGGRGFVSYGE